MTRQIKFRAWDEQDGVMIADFIYQDKRAYLDREGQLVHSTWHTLMQFTGLHDKNGKEIYEGDVVKKAVTLNKEMHGEFSYYEVTTNTIVPILSYVRSEKETGIPRAYMTSELSHHFEHESLAFGEKVETDELEVIGNIYENPELLKKDA